MEKSEFSAWEGILRSALDGFRSAFQELFSFISLLDGNWNELAGEEKKDLLQKASISSGKIQILFDRSVSDRTSLPELWGKIFRAMLHDLRSPLQGLFGCISILKEDWNELGEEEKKDLVQNLSVSSRNMLAIFQEFSEGGDWLTSKKDPEIIDLVSTINDVVKHLGSEAERKKVTVNVCPFDVERSFVFYKWMLLFAIRNIIANAIKFTDTGGTVKICVTKPNGNTRISIFDSGVGMSPERVKELFSPVKSMADTEGKIGSGIGLSLVKFFLGEYGGSISVESIEGKGTSFFLNFPKCQTL